MIRFGDFIPYDIALEIAGKYGTPLHVLSKRRLLQNVKKFRNAFPGVEIFYSLKANSHPRVIEILKEAGVKFDIASIQEFKLVKEAGGKLEDILYTHPIKTPDEIEFFLKEGIRLFIVDNVEELAKLRKYSGEYTGIKILIRILPSSYLSSYARINLSLKFGASYEETLKIAEMAREADIEVAGLAFHVGSQTTSIQPYVNSLIGAKKIHDILTSHGFRIEILDIGGGFPLPYPEWVPPLDTFAQPIRELLSELFYGKKIIAEPGRFIIGDAVILISRVIGKSLRDGKRWYFIDDSLYQSFSGKLYDKADYPVVYYKQKEIASPSVIAGRTCDSTDIIYNDILLPELEIGDIIVFQNMGAYTLSSASNFNGFPLPELLILEELK